MLPGLYKGVKASCCRLEDLLKPFSPQLILFLCMFYGVFISSLTSLSNSWDILVTKHQAKPPGTRQGYTEPSEYMTDLSFKTELILETFS